MLCFLPCVEELAAHQPNVIVQECTASSTSRPSVVFWTFMRECQRSISRRARKDLSFLYSLVARMTY